MSTTTSNAAAEAPHLRLLTAFLIAMCVVLLSLFGWWSGRERRALLEMSPEVRARVYSGAIASMAELCPAGSVHDAFSERCSEQAVFLSQFPECDGECRARIQPYLPQPTR